MKIFGHIFVFAIFLLSAFYLTTLRVEAQTLPTSFGKAIRLSGGKVLLTQRVTSDTSAFCPASTVEAWINLDPNSPNVSQTIFDGRSDYKLSLNSDRRLKYEDKRNVRNGVIWSTIILQPSVWYHVAAVSSGSNIPGENSQLDIYVNGRNEGRQHITNVNFGDCSYKTVNIGGEGDLNIVNPFYGKIDEVRVSSIPRYTGQSIPLSPFISDQETIALWHFNDNFLDSGPKGFHGEAIGTTAFVNLNDSYTTPRASIAEVHPSAPFTKATSGLFDVIATGAQNTDMVWFGAWTLTNQVDDLRWYQGINLGNGNWVGKIDLWNHPGIDFIFVRACPTNHTYPQIDGAALPYCKDTFFQRIP